MAVMLQKYSDIKFSKCVQQTSHAVTKISFSLLFDDKAYIPNEKNPW